MNKKIISALVASTLSFSSASIFVKFAAGVPGVVIAAGRISIAAMVLTAIALITKTNPFKYDKKLLLWSGLSGLFLAIHFILWTIAFEHTSVASVVALTNTAPVFVGIVAWVFLKNKPDKFLVMATIAAVVGSIILVHGDGKSSGTTMYGDILAILSAIFTAFYMAIGSYARAKVDLLSYTVCINVVGGGFLLLIVFFTGNTFIGWSNQQYFFILMLALLPHLTGHTVINWVLKYVNPTIVALSNLLAPIFAALMARFFFGEQVTTTKAIGMAIIFTAIILSTRSKKAMNKNAKPAAD